MALNSIAMDVLISIFKYAIGSMFIGVVLTIFEIALFFLLIRGWYKKRTFNVMSVVVGALLFILLCFQNILLCGTIHIKGMSNDFETALEDCVQPWVDKGNPVINPAQVDDLIFRDVAQQYPIIQCYVGGSYFRGYHASELPHAIVDTLNEWSNKYILRRLVWSLLFVIVGAIIVIRTMAVTINQRKTIPRHTTEVPRRSYTTRRRTRR